MASPAPLPARASAGPAHQAQRPRGTAAGVGIGWVLLACLLLLLAGAPAVRAAGSGSLPLDRYRCDGEPLTAQLVHGAVDASDMPDPSVSPVPMGGVVLLEWGDLHLQLPRTNNAGPASFSDGRWWWSLEDPAQPRFRQRLGLGQIHDHSCVRDDDRQRRPVAATPGRH